MSECVAIVQADAGKKGACLCTRTRDLESIRDNSAVSLDPIFPLVSEIIDKYPFFKSGSIDVARF